MRLVLLFAIASVAQPRAAAAQPCAEEAAELRAHLDTEARRARRWNTAWAIGFGTAAAAQLTLGIAKAKPFGTFDRDYEETVYVGAIKASVGLFARAVLPLRIRVPRATDTPCSDVPALRSALADAGRRERRTFWLTHLGGMALNLAGVAVLTYRRSFRVGAISFLISSPVGPASAYTQPRRSWHEWRDRRASWTVGVSTGEATMLWLANTH